MSTDAAETASTRYEPPIDQPATSSVTAPATVGDSTWTASVSV